MNVVEELENVLAEEQELLLTGEYTGLQALLERKSKLAETLAARISRDLSKDDYQKLAANGRVTTRRF